MQHRHHLIVGAGITGLVCAYSLSRQGESFTLLEASACPGGWCHTDYQPSGYTEIGPRTFASRRTPELLKLVHQLGLSPSIVWASKEARRRFLWDGHCMLNVPPSLGELVTIPLFRQLIGECIREGFRSKGIHREESLQTFLTRRFGRAAAALCVPIVQGIWAADPSLLDASACLGALVRAEQEHGGIVRSKIQSLIRSIRKPKRAAADPTPHGLWTLQRGIGQLIDALTQQVQDSLHLGQTARRVSIERGGWRLQTSNAAGANQQWQGSHVWICLPHTSLKRLEGPWNPPPSLMMGSIRVIDCQWNRPDVLPPGFGYLCLHPARETLLGAVYDSACFPHQSPGSSKATLMQGGAFQGQRLHEPRAIEDAVSSFCRHTGLPAPDRVQGRLAEQAIAHYHVGIQGQLLRWQQQLQRLPPIQFLGASWGGVAVEDCVRSALKQSREAGGCARSAVVPGYIPRTSSDEVPDRGEQVDIDTACPPPERNRQPC